MLNESLENQELVERVKCIKCQRRDATRADKLCDSCRFMATLMSVTKDRNSIDKAS
jgi:NMD protein affecting ribosome stability and mRNA decay